MFFQNYRFVSSEMVMLYLPSFPPSFPPLVLRVSIGSNQSVLQMTRKNTVSYPSSKENTCSFYQPTSILGYKMTLLRLYYLLFSMFTIIIDIRLFIPFKVITCLFPTDPGTLSFPCNRSSPTPSGKIPLCVLNPVLTSLSVSVHL